MKFSSAQIKALKDAWSSLKTIDPANPAYIRLKEKVKMMTSDQQKQLAEAGIPWVSALANLYYQKNKNSETASLDSVDIIEALEDYASEIATASVKVTPAAAIFANSVEKMRNGEYYALNDVSHLMKRLSYSNLSSQEIASRLTDTFRDVLVDI